MKPFINSKIRHSTLLILFCIFGFYSQSQEHVYTKKISKTIPAQNKKLIIDAEKANIYIQSTETNFFIIEINFISMNTDKVKAEYQLNYFKYTINSKQKEVYIRNYIQLDTYDKLSGSIVANYYIQIPANKPLTINNSLGDIVFENIEGSYTITSKYGNINLTNIKGSLNITNNIGEVILKDCVTNSSIETKYSNAYFHNCKGNYKLNSELGSINLNLNKGIKQLNINSSGTQIILQNKNCIEYNLDLNCIKGKLFIDKCNTQKKEFLILDNQDTENNNTELIYLNPTLRKNITIRSKYANISLQ